MDDETRKVIERIEKLLRLAGANPNEKEAASAAAKAQELLVAYNLDMAVIEQSSGRSEGKRLEEQFSGGMHKYQRQLWENVAELNFCMYWTQKVRVKTGSIQDRRGRHWTHEHRLVGRQVNVIGTRNMAGYLNGTIERLCREMLGSEAHSQFYSRDAVAYREGVADRVIEKIISRRADLEKAEAAKEAKAARDAAAKGISLATTLTVAGLSEKEEAGNYDFLYGEGAWAKKKQAEADWEAGREERRVARAKAEADAEAEFARWAAENPEEARKEAAKERARERAAERRRERGGGYGRYRFRSTPEELRQNSGSYHRGYTEGEKVSIDPQVDGGQRRVGKR